MGLGLGHLTSSGKPHAPQSAAAGMPRLSGEDIHVSLKVECVQTLQGESAPDAAMGNGAATVKEVEGRSLMPLNTNEW